jgi:hypothetical protein
MQSTTSSNRTRLHTTPSPSYNATEQAAISLSQICFPLRTLPANKASLTWVVSLCPSKTVHPSRTSNQLLRVKERVERKWSCAIALLSNRMAGARVREHRSSSLVRMLRSTNAEREARRVGERCWARVRRRSCHARRLDRSKLI